MKKNKLLKICGYVLSALLFISYFAILSSAAHPDVCYEYEQYYITRELEDWPGYGGLAYQPGDTFCFYNSVPKERQINRRGKGWGLLEEDGCWTYGDEAILFFTELPEKDMVLELLLTDMEKNTVTEVYAGTEKIGEIRTLNEPDISYLFSITAQQITDGKLKLGFQTKRQAAPVKLPALGIKAREITIYED